MATDSNGFNGTGEQVFSAKLLGGLTGEARAARIYQIQRFRSLTQPEKDMVLNFLKFDTMPTNQEDKDIILWVLIPPTDDEPETAQPATDPYGLNDKDHLKDRHDILLTADEYFLSVITSDHDLESDDDYEYRDIDDLKPLIDEGLLELERTEIRTNGATVDVYTLTAKGRWEKHLDESEPAPAPEAEAAPASEPEPEAAPESVISEEEIQLVIYDRLTMFIMAELLTSLQISSYILHTEGELEYLWKNIEAGLKAGFHIVDHVALGKLADIL